MLELIITILGIQILIKILIATSILQLVNVAHFPCNHTLIKCAT